MPTRRIAIRIIAVWFIATAGPGLAQAGESPAYPADYRDWTHVKSMVIHPGHALADPFQGIHHVYANTAARNGLRNGTYADGAAFAFDLLEYDTVDDASTEGGRILLGVMVKDSDRYSETGGWGFEAWQGGSRSERMVNDGGAGCFGCHEQVADRDYVFSQWRD
jgi:hypothetical protein